MEDFKINLFEKSNKIFPKYEHLSLEDSAYLKCKISEQFKVNNDNLFTLEILRRQKAFEYYVDDKSPFIFIDVLTKLKINAEDYIFINWWHYDNIDKIKISDFDKYFDDIWYPCVDDIDIFDNSCDWIITIRHDGYISYITK